MELSDSKALEDSLDYSLMPTISSGETDPIIALCPAESCTFGGTLVKSNHTMKNKVMLGSSLSDKINPICAASLTLMVSQSQMMIAYPLKFELTR